MQAVSGNARPDFQDRIGRINSGASINMDDALVSAETRAAFRKQQLRKQKRPDAPVGNFGAMGALMAFFIGAFSVLIGRLTIFHLSDSKWAQSEAAVAAMHDASIDVVIAVILTLSLCFLLGLRGRGQKAAELLGFVTMLWGEATFAALAPGLWTLLYSAQHAADLAAIAGLG